MAKKKSNRSPQKPPLPRRLAQGLEQAKTLIEQGQASQAYRLLLELENSYPNRVEVLELLADACYHQEDWRGYEWALHRLVEKERNHVLGNYAVGIAYLANNRPVLAVEALERFLKRWPEYEKAPDAQRMLEQSHSAAAIEVEKTGLPVSEAVDVLRRYEYMLLLFQHGQYQHAARVGEQLLKKYPQFVPVSNSLAQLALINGDWKQAEVGMRRVLELEPDNVQTLGTLVRLLFVTGRFTEAAAAAEHLSTLSETNFIHALRMIEALSWLGDDQGVVEVYAQTDQMEALDKEHSPGWPLMLHLAAVANARLGQEATARSLWQQALTYAPDFETARKNLEDTGLPIYERNGPWAFAFTEWVTEQQVRALSDLAERISKLAVPREGTAQAAAFLDEQQPELLLLAPHLLARGDETARQYIFSAAVLSGHPVLLDQLQEFTFGQVGSDRQRLDAANVLLEWGRLEPGLAQMWIRGEWRQTPLLYYEIAYETQTPNLSPYVQDLVARSGRALQSENLVKAAELLEEAAALAPDEPTLLNNAAVLYWIDKRYEKAGELTQQVNERFPDYFFSILSKAQNALQEGDLEQAEQLLEQLSARRELHITELESLCKAQMDLQLARSDRETARLWFDLWERMDLGNPDQEEYREKLIKKEGSGISEKLTRRLSGQGRGRS